MGVKYKMQWTNVENDSCTLDFIVDDDIYSGQPITIYGGPRPFVLSEFNTNSDLFKPIRPQQGTIEVLASISGVNINDFIIENDDRQMIVAFRYSSFGYMWYGALSQEDMSETWIAQNHILTLRADEGFGAMKTIPLQNSSGQSLAGKYTPFELIQYASTESVRTFFRCFVFSNLFHEGMSTGVNETGIEQCFIDARTFEQSADVFQDSYTVIEKVNRAFNQTLFQYRGEWFILRIEELFIPPTSNLNGFQQNRPLVGQRQNLNRRYDVFIGVNQTIKPIVPEMLRYINKPSKVTKVIFDWARHEQIVCNQSFKKGTLLGTTVNPTFDLVRFSVNDWSWEEGTFGSYTPSNGLFERRMQIVDNNINDEYIQLEKDATKSSWLRSCNVYVNADDNISVSLQYSFKTVYNTQAGIALFAVHLTADDNTYYTLDDDKKWYPTNSSFSADSRVVGTPSVFPVGADWYDFIFEDAVIPKTGYIQFILLNDRLYNLPTEYIFYRDLNVQISPKIQKFRGIEIKGTFDQVTIDKSIKKNFEDVIYLDDMTFDNYKGSIYKSDLITRTNGKWFRRRYSDDVKSFKGHNAIANWWLNKNYRMRLDGNFFGLKSTVNGISTPIGLMNTIRFVDDAPTKVFYITNLKEVDYMNCTWSAELLEIWDTEKDEDVLLTNDDVYLKDFFYDNV